MRTLQINQLEIKFNYNQINKDFTVVKFTTTDKYIKYGAQILDELSDITPAKAVVFTSGKVCYSLFSKKEINDFDFHAILSRSDFADSLSFDIISDVETKKLPSHILSQLLLNSISSPKNKRISFNNLTGRLFLFSPNHFEVGKKKNDQQVFKVVGTEVKIEKDLTLTLSVRTFTSLLLYRSMNFEKRRIDEYPKYTFAHSTNTLRRVLNSENIATNETFILKQTKNKKSFIPFIDFVNYDNFQASKIGILDHLFRIFAEKIGEYITLSFERIEIENTLRYNPPKINLPKNLDIYINDKIADEESDVRIRNISLEIKKYFPEVSLAKTSKTAQSQIILIHNKEHYEKYDISDPYLSSIDSQHLTYEDFNANSKASIKAIINEILLKKDVKNNTVSIIDWKVFNYSKSWIFGIKMNHKFHFLSIDPNGTLSFETFEPNLFNQSEYDELCEIFELNENTEYIIKDDYGNINSISRTSNFTIPEYDFISKELQKENNPISINRVEAIEIIQEIFDAKKVEIFSENIESLNEWNKNNLLSCFTNRYDKKLFTNQVRNNTGEILKTYFRDSTRFEIIGSQLDIHLYTINNKYHYSVGIKNKGIHQNISRASVIRQITPIKNSKIIFPEIMDLMNVDFIKNGDLTVVPFPIKYLKEWINCQA